MPESNVFIHMSDGIRLAATLYLPDSEGPWPALLEAYPYRKDDLSVWAEGYRRLRDEGDYAVCRLDVRGTGTSEGIATAEYPPQEQDDLCEVIEWLSRQEWCTGSVGMFGTSYSGFNTIQTAMRQPPALKAIIPIYATDDRYTDDIHFGGGIRKAIEFGYPLFMVSMNALPPVPSLAGEDWRRLWLERIDELVPWFGSIEEQNDGPFWRQGSLRPDYHLITVPTMVVAGWADIYRNALLRVIEHLQVPKRLLMGPWCHMSPNDSIPGPRIDLVPEMIRWCDRWLRGIENGVDTEPPLAFFIQRSTPPEPDLREVRGGWRFEPEWPPARSRELVLPLETADLTGRSAGALEETLRARGDVGATAHVRGSYDPPYGLPLDQRPDEVYSLVYDWPVEKELEILGNPVLAVTLQSSEPVAFVSAKLCEVLDDGTSVLVSRGILNLTHRDSHTTPEPLVPGETYEVSLELDATSWVFEVGHRIRLAIAGSDWPNAWPPPEASELTVVLGGTRLVLPMVAGEPPIEGRPRFVPIEEDRALPSAEDPGGARAAWRIERDIYARETRVLVHQRSTSAPEDPWRVWRTDDVRVGVKPLTPGIAWVESTTVSQVEWPEVTARTDARLLIRSDSATYSFDLTLDVFEDDRLISTRHWETVTPRKLQ
jgi:predicted acyl esterase